MNTCKATTGQWGDVLIIMIFLYFSLRLALNNLLTKINPNTHLINNLSRDIISNTIERYLHTSINNTAFSRQVKPVYPKKKNTSSNPTHVNIHKVKKWMTLITVGCSKI